MFKNDDAKRIIRLLSRNDVILFLGAGFSLNVTNQKGENFPSGKRLAELFWDFLGYTDDYDNTPLTEMYQAFLTSSIKRARKEEFLLQNLMSLPTGIPAIYDNVAIPYWYKIYTLNLDDILDRVYLRNSKETDVLQFPKDDYRERDQSLEKSQIVYLNGKLPSSPEDVIFSNTQYAKASLSLQPLYAQFVYDYAVKTTIFVGTDLNEAIFESYLEAREGRKGNIREHRPKSYLISPNLGPVKAENFKNRYNVHHIKGTTEDFLNWLGDIASQLSPKIDILKVTFPKLVNILNTPGIDQREIEALKSFAKGFERVPTDFAKQTLRSAYLLGSSPTWYDLFTDIDIPRTVTSYLLEEVENYIGNNDFTKIKILGLYGTAGSGKSTILKRLSLKLSQEGHIVFLSYSDFIPHTNDIYDALKSIGQKSVLIIDNAENVIGLIPKIITVINQLDYPPLLILSSRSNSIKKIATVMPEDVDYKVWSVPDLDDREIVDLIDKLDTYNLLGILKGLTPPERIRTFKTYARKQILIALKEATSGHLFEEIISDEFNHIDPEEAQILCVCISLNTELGFINTKQDFVGFSKVTHVEALDYLENTLQGTIMWIGGTQDKFMIRHRILAEHITRRCASLTILKEAYIRVLSILAPELKHSGSMNRKFKLYRSLINHQNLYARFHNEIEHAREVYDSVSEYFNDNFQYWLQYGCLELEGVKGDLDRAENYLNQAESLYSNNSHILNARCSLYYKKSVHGQNYSKAIAYKTEADELSNYILSKFGNDNPYIYHIHCRGRFEFLRKWSTDKSEKIAELKALIRKIESAIRLYPQDWHLPELLTLLNRNYLMLGTDEAAVILDLPATPDY